MYNKHAFTMTYIPGMNITYEEDEVEPAGKKLYYVWSVLSRLFEILSLPLF
jgi:hypothetical protein